MPNYNITGKIISISDKMSFDSGAEKLSFRIDTGEAWSNIVEFELFKGKEYIEHLDKFLEFNKIGDMVDVEFQLKCNHYTKDGADKVFTSLSCWRVNKVGIEGATAPPKAKIEDFDNLPF
tara:strand:- start:4369 stop:4728 length:360 start_codon:yes stop_codon:yes gene_type:complete